MHMWLSNVKCSEKYGVGGGELMDKDRYSIAFTGDHHRQLLPEWNYAEERVLMKKGLASPVSGAWMCVHVAPGGT